MASQYGWDDPRDVAIVDETGKRLIFERGALAYRDDLRRLLDDVGDERGDVTNQRTYKLLYGRLRATRGVREVKIRGRYAYRGVRLP